MSGSPKSTSATSKSLPSSTALQNVFSSGETTCDLGGGQMPLDEICKPISHFPLIINHPNPHLAAHHNIEESAAGSAEAPIRAELPNAGLAMHVRFQGANERAASGIAVSTKLLWTRQSG